MEKKRELIAKMLADFNKVIIAMAVIGPIISGQHWSISICGFIVIIALSAVAWYFMPNEDEEELAHE